MAGTFDSRDQISIYAEGHTRVQAGLQRVSLVRAEMYLLRANLFETWQKLVLQDVRRVVTPEVRGPQMYVAVVVWSQLTLQWNDSWKKCLCFRNKNLKI